MAERLSFRRPGWLNAILGLVAAEVALIGSWAIARLFTEGEGRLEFVLGQGVIGLFWMIAALALWAIRPPRTRVTAFWTAMGCGLAVALLGGGAVAIGLARMDSGDIGAPDVGPALLVTAGLALAQSLFHLLPAWALQQLALERR